MSSSEVEFAAIKRGVWMRSLLTSAFITITNTLTLSKKMTSEPRRLRTGNELRHVASSIAHKLLSRTKVLSSLLNYLISLLEIFNKETNRNRKLGYCDYEMAYVCYKIIGALCNECERQDKKNELVLGTRETYERKAKEYNDISDVIEAQQAEDTSEDIESDLLARFQNLKFSDGRAPPPKDHVEPKRELSLSLVDYVKLKGQVSAVELKELMKTYKILLVDFRASKDFNHNHISFPNIVNIEPSQVTNLLSQIPNCSDIDLEQKLSQIIPDAHLRRFKNRATYDLIVLYNFNHGPHGKDPDRFEFLFDRLNNTSREFKISTTPFDALIDLLMFRNKLPGQSLARYPCVLVGGVSNWYQIFGKDSITRTNPENILQRPPASLSRESSMLSVPQKPVPNAADEPKNGSPYLRNFGDYLSTVKNGSPRVTASSVTLYHTVPSDQGRNTYSPSRALPPTSRRTSNEGFASHKLPATNTNMESSLVSKPVARRTSTEDVAASTTKFLEQYVTGLTNLGNSCYMNCILQCLGATPQLTGFFFPNLMSNSRSEDSAIQSYRQHINVNNRLGTKGILTTNFVTLLKNMFSNTGSYFSPVEFKKVMGSLSPSKQFATCDQQDCIEFLDFLLDRLHEDLNQMIVSDLEEKRSISELTPEQEKTREVLPVRLASTIEWERYLKLNFSIIVDYFQGQYSSQLRCLVCETTSTTYNAFLILSLPIPSRLGNTPAELLLDDCLKAFVTTELLDDDNKWFCPKCKRHTKLTKKITITRLPQVLIIHFKRFKISPTGYFSKLDTFIKYPVNRVLDLTSYWPPVGTSSDGSTSSSSIMSADREQQVLSTLPTRNQVPPFRYKLYAVANHYGNLTTGHYTSYVRKLSDHKKKRDWCYFDDAKVTYDCKESQVLNKNAYCLFYQRI